MQIYLKNSLNIFVEIFPAIDQNPIPKKIAPSDLLNGVFNPEDNNTSSLKAFFTKSFKVHNSSISFDKKYYLKDFECT